MTINVQFELRNNPSYLNYIRYNSYWYKILTRDPNSIELLKKEYKEFIRKQKLNKFASTLEYIEMLENIISLKK